MEIGMVFERRSNLHPMNLLIATDPDQARAKILRAYKAGGFNHKGAADVLECHRITFIRWVKKLDMWEELDNAAAAAEAKGLRQATRGPARKSA
jgi:hypothetical protein